MSAPLPRRTFSVVLAAAIPLLAGCGNGTPLDTATCSSGEGWTGGGGEEGGAGPTMNPGGDCIQCHSQGEGPNYSVAGTVMGAFTDIDDCIGVEGVTITLTDANGDTTELTSNATGNFYSSASLVMPYTAVVTFEGRTSAMATPQSDGDCASCHTAEGLNDAPGRVVAP